MRESATFVGDYSLSFWRHSRPNHCRIKLKHENGTTKYYLVTNMMFDSLYSLIVYYRKNQLKSSEFSTILKDPVPQPKKHETMEWFHPKTTKEQAESVLMKREVGSFLVRTSEQNNNVFVISFTIPRKVKNCRIMTDGRLYLLGNMQFESLVSLVNHYTRNTLYRNVKLLFPVTQEMVQSSFVPRNPDIPRLGMIGGSCEFAGENSSYMDPPSNDDRITCKALFSYTAQQDDELSFPKHAIIINVLRVNNNMVNNSCEKSWWIGDYGGKLQSYFPSNYVKIIEEVTNEDYYANEDGGQKDEYFPRSDSIEIQGAVAHIYESYEPGILLILQIQTPVSQTPFEIGFETQEAAVEWLYAVQEATKIANVLKSERRKKEEVARVAKEMSDLIIYFRSVPFREKNWTIYEMSSFSETKAKQIIQQNPAAFLEYNRNHVSRVYPKGKRVDSSNFDPIPFWNYGSQMIALNYQSSGKAIQSNEARFRDNGNCGYILKPSVLNHEGFDPFNESTLLGHVEAKVISLKIIGARHLCRAEKDNISNPSVVVQVLGAKYDSGVKLKTKTKIDNGFNPIWNECCEFTVRNPGLSLLRFEVQTEDVFGDGHYAAQATFPVTCLRTGYRSVPLRNKFSEELELASLLVHISTSKKFD